MSNVLNAEAHFSAVPSSVGIERSVFPRPLDWKSTINASTLNCFACEEIIPGDTVDLETSALFRMTTPVFPVMDSCFADIFWFFVPMRLTWSHTKEFFGENTSGHWIPQSTYYIPWIDPYTAGITRATGDLAHQMGISPNVSKYVNDVNALPFRGYRIIWNEWFRDQNLQDPVLVNLGDTENSTELFDILPVNRPHDYFGSCLPSPQKGASVEVALTGRAWVLPQSDATVPLGSMLGLKTTTTVDDVAMTDGMRKNSSGYMIPNGAASLDTVNFNNLGVNFSNRTLSSVGLSINDFRNAFALQRIFEANARGGTRYREVLKNIFQVESPDASLQIPEFLCSQRISLNMSEVTQTAPTVSGQTPIGTIAGWSKTVSRGAKFKHSFTEHGYLYGLVCVRHNVSYSQGIHKKFKRRSMTDMYFPQFSHLGERPVYTYELDAQHFSAGDNFDSIFGYQEYGAEWRYGSSINSGLMDPAITGSLGSAWTYGDVYAAAPTLSQTWIEAGSSEVQRTLAVQNEDQFIVNIHVDGDWSRPMPTYSVPGLVDHF